MDINATLLGHVIWFGVFIWITMKYIWPPLQKAMHERQQEIAGGLAAAEQGRRDLEQAEKKSQDVITEARANASEIKYISTAFITTPNAKIPRIMVKGLESLCS